MTSRDLSTDLTMLTQALREADIFCTANGLDKSMDRAAVLLRILKDEGYRLSRVRRPSCKPFCE
jgi:hypothetical protein